ncbi:hypothetical protein F511_36181 [Dorcoceras hygrometricum]|uniref:Uncharacterized protein n=1 Tax=Dorcoceras hygrometricum TaxID=472368 RepID=A0A2Z7BDR6_9LAMI|nr:hypothetical protein F511_36181 [Dorcoceras hygrometricum]
MGLPIDGKPVTGRDFGKKGCEELCVELLGSQKYAAGRTCSQILMREVLDLKVVPEDVNGEDMDLYVRGYVLHCIGCLVCSSNNPATIPSMFLGRLRNVDELKDFAWGRLFWPSQ